jgi:soluble lytic murein transglycosylase-like protein
MFMSSINDLNSFLCGLLILVGVLCLGSGVAVGQRVRISDADVQISEEQSGPRVGSDGSERRGQLSILRRNGSNEEMLLRQAIYEESARYRIDPNLVLALVWQESGFKLNAVSPKNARGPLQLMPQTAARFGVRNPHDAKESVRGGVRYLVELLDRFGGNVSLALAAYNAGELSVEAYLYGKTVIVEGKVINRRGVRTDGIPPYAETINYVRRVAERYRLLRVDSIRELSN